MEPGTSYIYRVGTTPVTRIGMSTRSKVFSIPAASTDATLKQIGVMQSFGVRQSRNAEARRGIGYGDMIAELVPTNMDAVTLAVERFMLYNQNVMQTFGYNYGSDGLVRALHHHRYPFDVQHELTFPPASSQPAEAGGEADTSTADDEVTAIQTFYEACWMTSYSVTFNVNDTSIMETCDLMVTDVYKPSAQSSYVDILASMNASSVSVRLAGGPAGDPGAASEEGTGE